MSAPLYAPEQIVIPPGLPDVLKQFTKSAIKTQPKNIYLWAAEYFEALAAGQQPGNVSQRVSTITRATAIDTTTTTAAPPPAEPATEPEGGSSDVSVATLQEVNVQATKPVVGMAELKAICSAAGFPAGALTDVLAAGSFDSNEVSTANFIALAAGKSPGVEDLEGTMAAYIQVLGGKAAASELVGPYSFLLGLMEVDGIDTKVAALTAAGDNVTPAFFGVEAATTVKAEAKVREGAEVAPPTADGPPAEAPEAEADKNAPAQDATDGGEAAEATEATEEPKADEVGAAEGDEDKAEAKAEEGAEAAAATEEAAPAEEAAAAEEAAPVEEGAEVKAEAKAEEGAEVEAPAAEEPKAEEEVPAAATEEAAAAEEAAPAEEAAAAEEAAPAEEGAE
eukprot:CAMPEP_0206306418 /NCGR_PEP_ID=MMETSP0106_2-20121207/10788_1 /ASSEMBLY_ACC=CAM_ASM_000206 /TAXON_ID=81532 /ORGANISM="Acanthoeca-like sp., Strain 10tr" /LENGTH=393 /DNA_ID=CAMNT_0053737335 /DNA_START=30 /DNA_END=1208 /DNA_ORIENTATION=+